MGALVRAEAAARPREVQDELHGPAEQEAPDQFITICPAGDKRLFLWDEDATKKTFVTGRAYWFNDFDYHGVEAAPFFRYSLRVDGVFQPGFLEQLRRDHSP